MKILLIGNGEISKKEKEILLNLAHDKNYKIAAVDGGWLSLKQLNLNADYHLGDFDSSQQLSTSIHLPEQDQTDLEKSLQFLGSQGFNEFHLFSFNGKRFDHALNNLEIAYRYSKKSSMLFYTEDFKIYFTSQKFRQEVIENKIVSIFSFSSCTFKRSVGLKFALDNLSFSYGKNSQGISNLTSSNKIDLEFLSGDALIFIEH